MRINSAVTNGRPMGGVIRLEHKSGLLKKVSLVQGGPPTDLERWVGQQLIGFTRKHACIGARALSGLSDESLPKNDSADSSFYFSVYPRMNYATSAAMLITDLEEYFANSDGDDEIIKTFIAVFPGTFVESQFHFENLYWTLIQNTSDISLLSHNWPESSPSDSMNKEFELSLAGRRIFTTTLNPQNIRVMRQFSYPALVCNQTSQFDALRRKGQFASWQTTIRKDDAKIDPSGEPNPILANHGDASAAFQLAGSSIGPCPFIVRESPSEIRMHASRVLAAIEGEGTTGLLPQLISSRVSAFVV